MARANTIIQDPWTPRDLGDIETKTGEEDIPPGSPGLSQDAIDAASGMVGTTPPGDVVQPGTGGGSPTQVDQGTVNLAPNVSVGGPGTAAAGTVSTTTPDTINTAAVEDVLGGGTPPVTTSSGATAGTYEPPTDPPIIPPTSGGGGGGGVGNGSDGNLYGEWQSNIDETLGDIDEGEAALLQTLAGLRGEHAGQLGGRLEASRVEEAAAQRRALNLSAAQGGVSSVGGGAGSMNRQLALDTARMRDAIQRQHGQEALRFGAQEIEIRKESLGRKMTFLLEQAQQARAQGNWALARELDQRARDYDLEIRTLDLDAETSDINTITP